MTAAETNIVDDVDLVDVDVEVATVTRLLTYILIVYAYFWRYTATKPTTDSLKSVTGYRHAQIYSYTIL